MTHVSPTNHDTILSHLFVNIVTRLFKYTYVFVCVYVYSVLYIETTTFKGRCVLPSAAGALSLCVMCMRVYVCVCLSVCRWVGGWDVGWRESVGLGGERVWEWK